MMLVWLHREETWPYPKLESFVHARMRWFGILV